MTWRETQTELYQSFIFLNSNKKKKAPQEQAGSLKTSETFWGSSHPPLVDKLGDLIISTENVEYCKLMNWICPFMPLERSSEEGATPSFELNGDSVCQLSCNSPVVYRKKALKSYLSRKWIWDWDNVLQQQVMSGVEVQDVWKETGYLWPALVLHLDFLYLS